jgi:hypothetical protein
MVEAATGWKRDCDGSRRGDGASPWCHNPCSAHSFASIYQPTEVFKMFRFSPMKSVALLLALNAAGVVATELNSDHRINQVRELLHSSRQLQGEDCFKTSKALDSAADKLDDQAFAAAGKCTAFTPCTIDYKTLSAYSSYSGACSAAKGALATYKGSLSCSGRSLVLNSVPLCLVSTKTNKSCGPKMLEDFLEMVVDEDGCTETVTNTGYTDFSGSKPVKKPVKSPVRRRVLAME